MHLPDLVGDPDPLVEQDPVLDQELVLGPLEHVHLVPQHLANLIKKNYMIGSVLIYSEQLTMSVGA